MSDELLLLGNAYIETKLPSRLSCQKVHQVLRARCGPILAAAHHNTRNPITLIALDGFSPNLLGFQVGLKLLVECTVGAHHEFTATSLTFAKEDVLGFGFNCRLAVKLGDFQALLGLRYKLGLDDFLIPLSLGSIGLTLLFDSNRSLFGLP